MKQLNTRWKDLFKRSKNIRKKKNRNFSEKHYVLILNTFGIKGTDERQIVIMINEKVLDCQSIFCGILSALCIQDSRRL